ncbi:MAG TPA: glutaredoxin domain-containing protein [Aggregatilineales bacterium]|nr:glutaredoxin domain-containing protein [Aggregatilineales bacterium]
MANSHKITLYGHNTCPMVPPVEELLQRASVDYEYINIYQSTSARLHVREINNGFESVPTLVFPDDSTLTEPSLFELRDKLKDLGYSISRRPKPARQA